MAVLTTSSTDRGETVSRAAAPAGTAADVVAGGVACVNNVGSLGH
jgi:hypothetical protein